MAKKDKKKKKKDNPGTDAVGAVRTAVERTFHATADQAQSTRTRAQDLVDEVAGAAGRLREMIEQIGVLEDIKKQVDALSSRVAALERVGGAAKPAATSARKPASSRKPAARKTAARKSAAKSSGTRKASSSKKPAAKSSGTRKASSSKKPAAKRSS